MIPINPPVTYIPLSRVEVDGKRLYASPDGKKLPSVTTILDKTKDKTHLIEWRKRVGEAEANRISTESAGLGTLLHKHLENWVEGKDRPQGNNLVHQMARDMSDVIIERGLCDVSEVWGQETGLYYPDLYAGTTDLIGVYKGQPAIMDYKTTKKPKREDWIEDYYLQCCAYAHAHNKVYDTKIHKAVVFMVSRELDWQCFELELDRFDAMSEKWASRVSEYYSKYS